MLQDVQPVAGEPRTPKVALILIKVTLTGNLFRSRRREMNRGCVVKTFVPCSIGARQTKSRLSDLEKKQG
jgi:hypothetical protein